MKLLRLCLCALVALLLAPGCSRAQDKPESKLVAVRGTEADRALRLAYNTVSVIVQSVADVHASWMNAVADTGDVQAAQAALPVARRISAELEGASASLASARKLLDAGDTEGVREKLRDAIMVVGLAADLLAASGRPLPDRTLEALDFLRSQLGVIPAGVAP